MRGCTSFAGIAIVDLCLDTSWHLGACNPEVIQGA
jgi:hypothetical protein